VAKKKFMKLIIGLGNPGKKYQKTWHNLGFLILGEWQKILAFPAFKKQLKFQAETSEGKLGEEKIILAKPLTYMNNSGEAVAKIKNYYQLDLDQIIAIHDDIDLPLGKIRLAKNSSAGGHNGVKSLIETLGSQNFWRLKIGVKTPRLEKIKAEDYVLEKFNKQQELEIAKIKKTAVAALETGLDKNWETAMNLYN